MPVRPLHPLRALTATLSLCVALGGCATGGAPAASQEPPNPDPFEPMNRAFFSFNETLDRWVLDPLATAWTWALPDVAMTGIDNFFRHLNMPVVLANDILQGKPIAAIEDLARITHNTVFGFAGFYDIATVVGIPENDEDFGQTLGYYGVPAGPYLMVPILGPYTLRDGVGEIIDTTATGYLYSPLWTSAETFNLNTAELWAVSIGQKGVQLLNLRAIYDEELEESRKDAFDYYVFVRNAYLQSRRAKVADQTDAPVIDENELYFFDEEEDEEEDYDDF
jgi:phospholipid-binding lipoprotein MlaA